MRRTDVRTAIERAVDELPRGLRDHVLRVVDEAQRLAPRHGIDVERATLAALGHDLARAMPPGELLHAAETDGMTPTDVERSQPILLHGPLAARWLAESFGIEDAEVLAAARHHTTARPGMSTLEKLVYVADKIEPEKARADARIAAARPLADDDLDGALLRLLDAQIARALARGWPLHPDTVAAWNELVIESW